MSERSAAMQAFIDSAEAAFSACANSPKASSVVERVFNVLRTPTANSILEGERLPACAHLQGIAANANRQGTLSDVMRRFMELEPRLRWRRRADLGTTASANFSEGHANVDIIGARGLEIRSDVWVGASLLAPGVRYPDHQHPPEEVYLVMTGGEFRHGDSGWFAPGPGGSFYNSPNILHVMRSGDRPLFAFWVLAIDQGSRT